MTPPRASGTSRIDRGIASVANSIAGLFGARLRGFVDRIVADEISGWAFDPERPERRVLVTAEVGGQVVAETLADLPRRDLQASGRGDGRCGFRLQLPSGTAIASLRVVAGAGLIRRELKWTEATRHGVTTARTATKGESELDEGSGGPTTGFIERCGSDAVKGWAVDPHNPNVPAQIDIFDDEKFLGTVTASIDRPRLRQSGAPTGARGFVFHLPPGSTISPAKIRARISGSRLNLRRSRSYLTGGIDPDDAPSGPDAERKAGARAQPAAPKDVLFAIWGAADPQARRTSIDACRMAMDPADSVEWFDPLSPEAVDRLRRKLAEAAFVVFLAPGQCPADGLRARIVEVGAEVDVVSWRRTDEDGALQDDDLAVRLGAPSAGLAVRGQVAANWIRSGEIAGALDMSGLDRLATHPGLVWRLSPLTLATSPASPRASLRVEPPDVCSRLSVAIWSDWSGGSPAALQPILQDTAGLHLEILVPATTDRALVTAIADRRTAHSVNLDIKLVDVPSDVEDAALWRAMSEAATGQVVLLLRGDVITPPGAVHAAANWAMQPGVGTVSISLANKLAGLGSTPEREGSDRPAQVNTVAWLAVARASLAAVGGFDRTGDRQASEVSLATRLRQSGRRSILLGRFAGAEQSTPVQRFATLSSVQSPQAEPLD